MSKAKKPRARGGSWPRRVAAVAFFLLALALLGLVSLFAYYARDLPTVAKLKRYDPPQVSRVVDRNGRLIAESFVERRTVVPIARVPRVLVLSVLAAEDADFYRHEGLDYAGIARALVYDLLRGKPTQGASTITQQIVKNLLLTPERTLARKVRELILARRLEQELSKDEILFLYLNQINFGHGRYGVEEASRFYFGKHVQALTLAEASLVAGIPQAPARLSPLTHPQAARERQLYVLDQLARKRAQYWDDLSQEAIDAARQTPLTLREHDEHDLVAPEVATLARQALGAIAGAEAVQRGGFTVTTTIDLQLQQAARDALRRGLVRVDERQKLQGPLAAAKAAARAPGPARLQPGRAYEARVRGHDDARGELVLEVAGRRVLARLRDVARQNPGQLAPSRFAEVGARVRVLIETAPGADEPARGRMLLGPCGAAVVMDVRTREVLALVGSDEASYGFDRATQAVRQPGSTWKPISYALALESKRFTAASLLLDAPEVFDQWKPNNYETWEYSGAVRLREALAQSINLVAVRVTAEVTPGKVAELARQLGITTPLDPSLALALGASGVKPIELVGAYATFAAGGRYVTPRLVKRITDSAGRALALPPEEPARAVLSPAGAYLITSLLTSVVKTGTGKAAQSLRRPVAGKTGTSNKARDAWFVGYTPEVVAGVWVGYDDLHPLGRGESGANTALPIWSEIMKAATAGRPAVEFPVPAGVVTAKIDPATGKLAYAGQADAIDEVFLAGTEPTETATPPGVLETDDFLMQQQGAAPQ